MGAPSSRVGAQTCKEQRKIRGEGPCDPEGNRRAYFQDAVLNGANYHKWYMAGGGLVETRDEYEDNRSCTDERATVFWVPLDDKQLRERANAEIKKPPAS